MILSTVHRFAASLASLGAKFGVSRGHHVLFVIAGLLFSLFLLAEAATAGQESTASIVGQVMDESGAAMPGVTVSAASPALQVPEVMSITNERGDYRIAPLPIGTYTVTYTLAGFQSVQRKELRLTVGFVAKVDVVLKLGTFDEAVTVSGASPVVDVTSTTTRTELTREVLDLIPSGRNGITALLTQTPGVRSNLDVGGSNFVAVPSFRAFGQDAESWQTFEGVMTASSKDTQSGNQWDYSVIEEARVQAVGAEVDIASRGVALTAIMKSGGNDFHGSGWASLTDTRLQSNNLDESLVAQGLRSGNKLEYRWDLSADVGGRIIHDKLWFYVGGRARASVDDYAGVFKPDGSPAQRLQNMTYGSEKLSYQLNSSNKFVGVIQHVTKREISGSSVFVPWESRTDNDYKQQIGKIEWQAVKGSSLMTSLQYGRWQWNGVYTNHAPGQPATIDIGTLKQSGESLAAGNIPSEWRDHTTGRVTWYRPDMFLGNHEFKGGFDLMAATISRAWVSREFNYRLRFNNGVPFQIETFNYPVVPDTSNRYLSLYLKDNWVIARRLTLSLGVRYAHDRGFVPEQCHGGGDFVAAACYPKVDFNTWNTIAPRLSFAYDIGGGKTVVKGGWGRFDHMREIEELQPANKNIASATTYRWRDLNGNRDYNPGEFDVNPNGPDFVSVAVRDSGLFSNGVPNPKEKEPKVDQFSLSLERELISNLAVRISGIYSRSFNVYRVLNTLRPYEAYNIPISNPDPGPDGRVGTADDPGRVITYYDYPAALAGRLFQQPTLFNPPGQDQTFKSIELAGSKRLSKGWQFMASYSATKSNAPSRDGSSFDPNSEIFAANHTWEWSGKGSGTYTFPREVIVSAFFDHRSGTAQARQVLFTGGRQIPSIVLNVEPLGTRRLPNTNLLDLRLEKRLRLPRVGKVAVRLNIYNALNVNTITAQTLQSGPNFLRPTAFVPPRFLEFGVSYNF